MKLQVVNTILIVALIATLAFLFFSQASSPKIGYIQSIYLLENFEGTKEAYSTYQEKVADWKINADTLKTMYQATFASYKENEKNLSSKDKQKAQQDLLLKKQKYEQYQQAIQQKGAEEDQKITEGVFKQIDAYVKAYAKANGFDLIIGVGTDGNLLYGEDSYDLTEEVLEDINKKYLGKQ